MDNSIKKILVVDDEPANLVLINGILSSLYKVYPIESGADALEFLEMQSPDLILLDVEMPEMSGKDLLLILKSDKRLAQIPVIFLTGNISVDSEGAAFRLGVSDYIRKPIDDAIMLTRVKMHLELDAYRKADVNRNNA